MHVRQVGDWTRDLGDALGAGATQEKEFDGLDPMGMYEIALQHGETMPSIRVDGPYGAPAEDVSLRVARLLRRQLTLYAGF